MAKKPDLFSPSLQGMFCQVKDLRSSELSARGIGSPGGTAHRYRPPRAAVGPVGAIFQRWVADRLLPPYPTHPVHVSGSRGSLAVLLLPTGLSSICVGACLRVLTRPADRDGWADARAQPLALTGGGLSQSVSSSQEDWCWLHPTGPGGGVGRWALLVAASLE